jgi:MATE family multidrug resistance protein
MTHALTPPSRPEPLAAHLRAVFVLGLPLIGSNVAQMLVHVTDTVMLGWYGVAELAAGVLATGVFFFMFLLGNGFAMAVLGRVAAALGAGDETQMRRETRMGLWLALLFGVAAFPVFWWSGAILRALGQDAGLAQMAQDYLRVNWPGLPAALVVAVLKSYLAAQERTRVVLWITLLAVALNAALNWALIFGNWGAPEMGLRGAAISSVLVAVISAALGAIYAARGPGLAHVALFARFWRPDWPAFFAVARMGLPIGLATVFEAGMFQASALMMGWIGVVELAAHGIALELASVTFMVHMGFSHAATVRAGRALGRGDAPGLRTGAQAAVLWSIGFAALTVAAFLLWPSALIGLFLDRTADQAPAILALGMSLLAVAALFQFVDSLQVMAMGLLRGVHDTRVPMWIAGASYWLVGIPTSYVLAFPAGFGAVGLWLGLVAGLSVAALALMARFWRGRWIAGPETGPETGPGAAGAA